MARLAHRSWVPDGCESYVQKLADQVSERSNKKNADRISKLADRNRAIHERECFNLNPATNVMNPRAEALLAAGLGSRPGYASRHVRDELTELLGEPTGLELSDREYILRLRMALEIIFRP